MNFCKELVILDNEDSGYDDNLVTSKAAFLFDITNKKALYAKTLMKDYIRQASLS